MKKLAVLALGVLFAACGETPSEPPTMDAPETAFNVVLPDGNGIQRFTDDRDASCGELCIGVGPVGLPFFLPGVDLEIETGNWATLTFGWRTFWGQDEPTADDVLQEALDADTGFGFALSLGGTPIPLDDGFRPETISIFYGPVRVGTTPEGDPIFEDQWIATIRWVYYVKPQRKGTYVYHMDYQGFSWDRTLTYVPDDLGEDEA